MRKAIFALRLFIAIAFLFGSALCHAQTITGDIGGTVTDPSGAVVVGAKVTARNTSTNVSSSTVTNKDGIYSIRFLQIGQYIVSVTAKGFSTLSTAPFGLEVSQVAKVDAKLIVGSETTVLVSSDLAPILNAENGTVSTTLSQSLIEAMPVNGHNIDALTQYVPGVNVADGNQWNGATGSPNNSGERTQSFATLPNVNGNRTYNNNYTIDGVGITDSGANISNGFGAPSYTPGPDTVKEMTIITTVPPAEYGDATGGQFLVVLKSGTNQYHGSAYADLQNYLLDANTFGNKRSTPFTPRGQYTQKVFGGTFGGPIIIPKLFDGRNKLFFFVDYEGYRKPSSGTGTTNVPLNAWRGITTSTGSVDASVSPLAGYAYFGNINFPQMYDSQNGFAPFNQTINGTTYYNLVPIRNPVAKYLFANSNLWPSANHAAATVPIQNNYQSVVKALQRNDQADIKVDWKATNRDSIFARVTGGEAWDGQSKPLMPISFPGVNDFPFNQYVGSYTRVFSPAIVNEFRAGFTRIAYKSFNQDISGLFGSGNSLVGIPFAQFIPGFSQQSFSQSSNSTGVGTIGTTGSGNVALDNHFTYADNLTWQHGRHIFKFGAQLLRIQNNFYLNNTGGLLGGFTYNGTFTGKPAAGTSVGYDFADFLLDYAVSRSVSTQSGNVGQRQSRIAFFAQDDFKVTPTLTVNYGLRWEYDQPVYEVNNKISNISPTTGAVLLAGVNGNSRSLYKPVYDQFSPRLGLAYQITPRFVLRAGFGITNFMDYNVLTHTGNSPFHLSVSQTATAPSSTSSGSPFLVTSGFPTASGSTSSFTSWGNLRPQFVPQYSLATEYAVSGTASVTVQYIGEVGQHLSDIRNINQETLVGTPSSAPFYSTAIGTGTFGNSAIKLLETEAYSSFNAGEVSYRQRPWKGLEYTFNYTYSKTLSDTGGPIGVNDTNAMSGYPQNSYCLRCDYGPTGSDTRHMLNWTSVYALPFGRGQRLLGSANRLVDEVVGGWRISGNSVLLSGFPNTILANGSANVGTAGSLRANHYRHMKVVGHKAGYVVNDANGNETFAGWWGTDPSALHSGYLAGKGLQVGNTGTSTCGNAGFDDGICAYGQPAAGVTGSAPIFGTASVGTEHSAGYVNYDAHLEKTFPIYEAHALVFSANGYNVGNITSYNNPGRGISGNSTWGLVQSTRSQQRQLELELKYKF
jgi:Carboxypeptidase regulatory-like domain/TonB-dependent Receptor Plug Domain/TonB dependent receptor